MTKPQPLFSADKERTLADLRIIVSRIAEDIRQCAHNLQTTDRSLNEPILQALREVISVSQGDAELIESALTEIDLYDVGFSMSSFIQLLESTPGIMHLPILPVSGKIFTTKQLAEYLREQRNELIRQVLVDADTEDKIKEALSADSIPKPPSWKNKKSELDQLLDELASHIPTTLGLRKLMRIELTGWISAGQLKKLRTASTRTSTKEASENIFRF